MLNKPQNLEIEPKNDSRKLSKERGDEAFRLTLKITAWLAIVVIIGLGVSLSFYDMTTVESALESADIWLAFWRLGIFLALIGGWNRWTALYANWSGMEDAQYSEMLSYRWRIALWLLVMEAVLSQKVLSKFFSLMS
jgi:hypothetical protein